MPGFFESVTSPTDCIFLNIRDGCGYDRQRYRIERLWLQYKPYADDQFLVEIGIHFRERFWEMCLACELLKQGFSLVPKASLLSEGPDICILMDHTRTWVEAVTPNAGIGPDAVDFDECDVGFVPESKILLRYLGAIETKRRKLCCYLAKGIVQPSDRYVIAVSGSNIPGDWEPPLPYVAQAVFPLGPLAATIDRKKGRLKQGHSIRRQVTKRSGRSVPTTLFLCPESAGISGIISGYPNAVATTRLTLTLIHNPLAQNPLPMRWLSRGVEYWVEHDMLRRRTLCGHAPRKLA